MNFTNEGVEEIKRRFRMNLPQGNYTEKQRKLMVDIATQKHIINACQEALNKGAQVPPDDIQSYERVLNNQFKGLELHGSTGPQDIIKALEASKSIMDRELFGDKVELKAMMEKAESYKRELQFSGSKLPNTAGLKDILNIVAIRLCQDIEDGYAAKIAQGGKITKEEIEKDNKNLHEAFVHLGFRGDALYRMSPLYSKDDIITTLWNRLPPSVRDAEALDGIVDKIDQADFENALDDTIHHFAKKNALSGPDLFFLQGLARIREDSVNAPVGARLQAQDLAKKCSNLISETLSKYPGPKTPSRVMEDFVNRATNSHTEKIRGLPMQKVAAQFNQKYDFGQSPTELLNLGHTTTHCLGKKY